MLSSRQLTFKILILSLLGISAAVLVVPLFRAYYYGEPATPTPPRLQLPPTPDEIAKPHFERALQVSEQAVTEHIQAVDEFFTDAKKNTPLFAKEVLSWHSKWRLMVDYVPYTQGNRHSTFLRERFEAHLFTPVQLEEAMQRVVRNYMQRVQSIESQMLVDLRADMADFPSACPLVQMDQKQLQATYEQALVDALKASSSSLSGDVAAGLAALIATEVLTQVAVRLGISAGLLGAGAASSWATVGISFVLAGIVDVLVGWTWEWWSDPEGNLVRELNQKLDELQRLIVQGSSEVPGLRDRLLQLARQRDQLRRQVVLSLLQPAAGEMP